MNNKIIICAGGNNISPSNLRWNNYLGLSRYMIPAYGEPLIHRLQKQLKEHGFTNIHLACTESNKDLYLKYDTIYIESPKRSFTIKDNSVIWSYQNLLNREGTTTLFFADTFYTDNIIKTIKQDSSDLFRVYGRNNRSSVVENSRQGEIFAYVVGKNQIDPYLRAVEDTAPLLKELVRKRMATSSDLAKLSLKKFFGLDYREINITDTRWVEWDDLTDDFDFPDDWNMKSKLFPNIFYV